MPHVASADDHFGGKIFCQWNPTGASGPELLVVQGDLTSCKAGAIVNAANSHLMHGGGLAAAIVRKGGISIQQESSKRVKDHGELDVGKAVTTAAGKLSCNHIIHTVGPDVRGSKLTLEHTTKLHEAVWSALMEAHRLKVDSVALPGISTGIFGYPRDLGAQEIVKETVRFCKEKGKMTTVKRIALMNIDEPTVISFVKALQKTREESEKQDVCNKLARLEIHDKDN
ncbi:Hismacro and SEC14 domain-containing proteins [Plasmopara halstedii]|uniref:Hismacro and SEC14 domain-containing proteins n=1 Tax=Plasmopara halstedii TaxID=4781 RepID=A0A0P1AA16_PLAHL|nr:Hismacro and SEC14 domain-containing proteins [Plasmopara halstedii]CEG37058.1 Hismacro and SEC14 domain-containing proteins [Plasmopara halstedii]|eukprot:XP_024573427.1 Hismacro and SEC14 domain-containing proteins [Plasmopara halstedii]